MTRNAVFSLASQLTTALLTAVLTVLLVRLLEPADYGLFALAMSVNGVLLLLADFGVSSSTARYVAERRGYPAALGSLFVDSLKLKLLIAGGACTLLLVAAGPAAEAYGKPELAWPLRGIALATLGQSLMLMASGVFTALARVRVRLRVVLAESVTELGASIALVLLGGGAVGAAFGRATGYLLGGVLGLALALRLVGHPRLGLGTPPRVDTARRVGRYASSLLVVDAAYTLSASANVLLVGAHLGSVASAVYAAPARLMILLQYPGLSVANAVGPRLARGGDDVPDVHALGVSLRGLVVFQCLLLAPVIVWADPVVKFVLGSRYGESGDVLAALAPYLFFFGLAPVLTIGVNYLGEARRRVPIALISLAIWVGGALVLIPSVGVVGAAVAADVGLGVYVMAHFWLCRRLLRLRLAPLALALLRSLAAAVAMALVLLLIGTEDVGLGLFLAGGAAGGMAYLGVLLLTGEVAPGELARLGASVRSRFARMHPAR